jgi:hypothetical protein
VNFAVSGVLRLVLTTPKLNVTKPMDEERDMGNHNILITNPKGERKHQFADNVSLDKCKDYLEEFGPAPIGWHYQIINANKKKRTYPKYILLQGYKDTDDGSYELVDTRKARVKMNSGRWYSMKRAKKDARAQGATWFTREKIWPSNGE